MSRVGYSGVRRDDLFNTNASIVKGIAEQCAKSCPKACFLIISNPVNSTVPIFGDVLKVWHLITSINQYLLSFWCCRKVKLTLYDASRLAPFGPMVRLL